MWIGVETEISGQMSQQDAIAANRFSKGPERSYGASVRSAKG